MELSKKQAFKNNKKSNLETLYLKYYAELRGEIKIPTKFIKFAFKQNGSLQASPMQVEGRELFPYKYIAVQRLPFVKELAMLW